jgi:hypothetical protein
MPRPVSKYSPSSQGSAPVLLYIEGIGHVPLTAGESASSRNKNATSRPAPQPGTRGCFENSIFKTKTAQPFSGAAPFSAIK